MASFDDVVIISGCRLPVGKFQGSLADFTAPQLGAMVVREAVKRAGVDPAQVDECVEERQRKRSQQGHRHRQRQRAKEDAGDTGQ